MNLLNKKIKDKIKLLDDIDKQYVPKVHVHAKTKKNDIINKKENFNENNNLIKFIKNSKNENFDKIYSNFILSGNMLFQNLNLKNGDNSNDNDNNNNLDESLTNENSEKKEIHQNVGDRLNNYGKYVKNKIENQRRIENNKIKNLNKPKINRTRNKTEKTEPRLIQNYKKNFAKSNKNNKSNQKNNSSQYINSINNFTYHPKINKKSLILAKKMEPSSIRLNKKKKVQLDKELKPTIFYANLYKHKPNNTPRKNSNKKNDSKNKSIYEKMNDLYLRGIEQKQKKEKKINENKKAKEEEYKKYSFQPKVNKVVPYYSTKNKIKKNLSLIVNNSKTKKYNSKLEFKNFNIYEKNWEWKRKLEKENIKKKKLIEEQMQKLCTFHPKLTEKENIIKNSNKKHLNKVFEQINVYMIKRRQSIKNKVTEENYKKKKFYVSGEGYTPRSTIPQEFEFQTEIRERSLGKNKNRSCENFHINKNKNSDKKSFGENENHSWFFKEEMSTNGCNYNSNISNINESNGTKEAFFYTQFDFIEAVNLLHDKLDKLNI